MMISFRCYYGEPGERNYTNHYQDVEIQNIPKWIDCYRYTHPNVKAISIMMAFTSPEKVQENSDPGE